MISNSVSVVAIPNNIRALAFAVIEDTLSSKNIVITHRIRVSI